MKDSDYLGHKDDIVSKHSTEPEAKEASKKCANIAKQKMMEDLDHLDSLIRKSLDNP